MKSTKSTKSTCDLLPAENPKLFFADVQVQTAAIADKANQTPPPDEGPYFTKNQFNTEAGDDYDPAVSDSENGLYLIKFGKRKAKA